MTAFDKAWSLLKADFRIPDENQQLDPSRLPEPGMVDLTYPDSRNQLRYEGNKFPIPKTIEELNEVEGLRENAGFGWDQENLFDEIELADLHEALVDAGLEPYSDTVWDALEEIDHSVLAPEFFQGKWQPAQSEKGRLANAFLTRRMGRAGDPLIIPQGDIEPVIFTDQQQRGYDEGWHT